jgi:hypothetical protein
MKIEQQEPDTAVFEQAERYRYYRWLCGKRSFSERWVWAEVELRTE